MEGILVSQIAANATTATVKVKAINGATPTWLTTAHRITVLQSTRTVTKVEVIGVAAGTTQSGSTVTLGTLTRGLPLDGTGFTGTGTAQVFTSGAKVIITWDAQSGRQTAFKDIANTFTDAQTFNGDATFAEAPTFEQGTHNTPFANAAARDAYFTAPVNGDSAYLTAEGYWTDYVAGSWLQRAAGSSVVNMSDGIAGKGDTATVTEIAAGTADDAVSGAPNVLTVGVTEIAGTAYAPAYLTGGASAEATAATWAAITSTGKFKITIDGTEYDDVTPDFTGDVTMDDVAESIQTAIQTATSGSETVTWSTDHFIISSVDATVTSAITVTATPSTGTDISGAGSDWMDCDGGTVTDKAHLGSGKIPVLNTSGVVNATLGGTGRAADTAYAVICGSTTGTGAQQSIAGLGNAGQVLKSAGAAALPAFGDATSFIKPVFLSTTTSATLTNPTSATAYATHTYTIPANDLVNGVIYEFELIVTATHGASNAVTLGVGLGASSDIGVAFPAATGTDKLKLRGTIYGTAAASGTSSVIIAIEGRSNASATTVSPSALFVGNKATNGTLAITFFATFGTSDGGNNTNALASFIRKFSTTAF